MGKGQRKWVGMKKWGKVGGKANEIKGSKHENCFAKYMNF